VSFFAVGKIEFEIFPVGGVSNIPYVPLGLFFPGSPVEGIPGFPLVQLNMQSQTVPNPRIYPLTSQRNNLGYFSSPRSASTLRDLLCLLETLASIFKTTVAARLLFCNVCKALFSMEGLAAGYMFPLNLFVCLQVPRDLYFHLLSTSVDFFPTG